LDEEKIIVQNDLFDHGSSTKIQTLLHNKVGRQAGSNAPQLGIIQQASTETLYIYIYIYIKYIHTQA